MSKQTTLALLSALALGSMVAAAGCSDEPAVAGADSVSARDGGDDAARDLRAPDGNDDGARADVGAVDVWTGRDGAPPLVFGGSRPVALQVPKSYDARKAYPLVLILHGFSAWGSVQQGLFGHGALVDSHGFLLAAPDGTKNSAGLRFWNATAACCAFGDKVDDVGYLSGLITEISAAYNVDARRVYLVGHSNGGFMSYRMACDASKKIAAIVSLAGAMHLDAADCKPTDKVSILQVHGTLDVVIRYDGGQTNPLDGSTKYPAAKTSVEYWRGYNGCQAPLTARSERYNLDALLPGDETSVESYSGCPAGIDVALWTIKGANHVPALIGSDFAKRTLEWMFAHPKP